MLFVMNSINSFLNATSEVKNIEIFTLAITGIIFGLVLAELLDVIRTNRAKKAKEASR
jgi:hypothetical protein